MPSSTVFTVTTLGLTGSAWLERLSASGHRTSNLTKSILSQPDYDLNHRYEAGKTLKVFLTGGNGIKEERKRTTKNLKALVTKQMDSQAVSGLKGELALLLREKITNNELQDMGLWDIIVLHTPIVDSDGGAAFVLGLDRFGDWSWVGAGYDEPDREWLDHGAFAFLASP